uniref:(northern house mosquito) hypothetical protein n=1 Tax=Culex pipiens TaxID=7175 RepID=A0A8D8C979_CULPI
MVLTCVCLTCEQIPFCQFNVLIFFLDDRWQNVCALTGQSGQEPVSSLQTVVTGASGYRWKSDDSSRLPPGNDWHNSFEPAALARSSSPVEAAAVPGQKCSPNMRQTRHRDDLELLLNVCSIQRKASHCSQHPRALS